jgi:hypothetical protein
VLVHGDRCGATRGVTLAPLTLLVLVVVLAGVVVLVLPILVRTTSSVGNRRVGTVGFRVLGPFSGFGPFGYDTRNYPAAFDMCPHANRELLVLLLASSTSTTTS